MKSVFTEKSVSPTEEALNSALRKQIKYWNSIEDYCREIYPEAVFAWHFSGDKFGWSYRISDKKRVLVYLLPRDGFFKVAFVFGQKATDEIIKSKIKDSIKVELMAAKVYAEGRGIRLEVRDKNPIKDIQQLIAIKIQF